MVVRNFFAIVLVVSISIFAKAEVLFEGYFKILIGQQHAGYSITRYEFDPKKKQFIATNYIKTGALAGDTVESFKAISTDTLLPVSLQYTSISGGKSKTIDLNFKGKKMNGVVNDAGAKTNINQDLTQGTFLSSFLAYVMLQGKEGMKTGVKYDYQAIAEEDAQIHKGIAVIQAQEEHKGVKAFKILNEFKGSKFISYANDRGEMISTNSPALGVSAELVADYKEALGQFALNNKAITLLFGNMPTGQINQIYKNMTQKLIPNVPADPKLVPGKQMGVPAGQNIQIKPTGK